LSEPYAKANVVVHYPAEAAATLLAVIGGLVPTNSGRFLDYWEDRLPW
jgi:hypothetical protein